MSHSKLSKVLGGPLPGLKSISLAAVALVLCISPCFAEIMDATYNGTYAGVLSDSILPDEGNLTISFKFD